MKNRSNKIIIDRYVEDEEYKEGFKRKSVERYVFDEKYRVDVKLLMRSIWKYELNVKYRENVKSKIK